MPGACFLKRCLLGRKWRYNAGMTFRMRAGTWIFALTAPVLLSGCPAAVVAGATAGATAINDHRTIGALAEDEAIENKILLRVADRFGTSTVKVSATSYNRRVLLTGQVPNEQMKKEILSLARNVPNVRGVVDYLEIGNPSSLSSRTSDAVLTGRAKIALCAIQRQNFSCLDVKVVTEKGVLYLMGLISKEQAAIAIDAARNVPGVIRVVKVFEKENW